MVKIDPLEIVANIRGRGLFWGIEFCKNKSTLEPFNPSFNVSIKIGEYTKRNGVVVYPGKGTIDGIKGIIYLLLQVLPLLKRKLNLLLILLLNQLENL